MDAPLTETLLSHQRRAEWLFAAAVFSNEADARQQCGWLHPTSIQDLQVRDYWQRILDGGEASKAALEVGIFYKLAEHMTAQTFSSLYVSSFAETIADDGYLVEMAESLKRLASLINERRVADIQALTAGLAKCSPGSRVDGMDATEASLEFMGELDDEPDVIKTGIPKIDTTFGGFSVGTLNILAARPSMGKTALGLQFARACCDAGGVALYFSIEMKRKALWSRMVCGDANVDHRKYKTRTWSAEQRQACIDANNYLTAKYGGKLVIDDRSRVTTTDIWKAAAQYKPDLLIVDHLALVADEDKNNVIRVGKIAWGGKQIAKEFDCASLYLCQLNREVDRREVKMPTLIDLRDSGELEQDADTVMFIHRKDYYADVQQTVSATDLNLAKDREGVRNVNYTLQYHLVKQKFFETAGEATR